MKRYVAIFLALAVVAGSPAWAEFHLPLQKARKLPPKQPSQTTTTTTTTGAQSFTPVIVNVPPKISVTGGVPKVLPPFAPVTVNVPPKISVTGK